METGRQFSMPSNLNNPILTKQSILLLEDGFCFCSPEEKAFYPFSDFGVTPEDGIAEFLHQKSIVDDSYLFIFDEKNKTSVDCTKSLGRLKSPFNLVLGKPRRVSKIYIFL